MVTPALTEEQRAELSLSREESIKLREARRLEAIEEIKRQKAAKAAQREAERLQREQEEKLKALEAANIAELERKRNAKIERKERARRAKRLALCERKMMRKTRNTFSKDSVLLLKKVYDRYDLDGNGHVTIAEMAEGLRGSVLGDKLNAGELDKDGDGTITFAEIARLLYPVATEGEFEVVLDWCGLTLDGVHESVRQPAARYNPWGQNAEYQ